MRQAIQKNQKQSLKFFFKNIGVFLNMGDISVEGELCHSSSSKQIIMIIKCLALQVLSPSEHLAEVLFNNNQTRVTVYFGCLFIIYISKKISI